MFLTLGSIALLVVLDQLSKLWAVQVLQPVGSMPFLPGVLQLRYVLNDGAAFSLFAGRQGLLIGVTSVALAVMLWLLLAKKTSTAFTHWGLVLIVAGGLGNLVDRILNGVVVDFFDVLFMNFAVFNVADCFVTVGCVLLFIGILFEEKLKAHSAKKQTKQNPATVRSLEEKDHE